jgi:hypothetical protein
MTADTPSIPVIFNAQIVPRLQIQPVALGHAKVMRQTVRDLGADRTLTLHDLVEATRRDADFVCEAKDADFAGGEEFL